MSLQNWLRDRQLRHHETTPQEIGDLLRVVDRDLKDSAIEQLSDDRRFVTAYNAVLQLSTIVLHAAGYRTSGAAHHWLTFQCIPHIMGPPEQDRADYFDICRRKRNIADYDASGGISNSEVAELCAEATRFRGAVIAWLQSNHKDLLPTE